MIEFTKDYVSLLADKLLIGLTDEENEMVRSEFKQIDESINLINEIEGLDKQEPMYHCLDDFIYELRDDVAEESPAVEDLLRNSDDVLDREIVVPKVVGGEN